MILITDYLHLKASEIFLSRFEISKLKLTV